MSGTKELAMRTISCLSSERPAWKAQPGLLVRDLQELSKGLAGPGHEMTNGEPLDGYQHIYPNDPFGNRLELLEASGLSNT
jgi:hypothetical protein